MRSDAFIALAGAGALLLSGWFGFTGRAGAQQSSPEALRVATVTASRMPDLSDNFSSAKSGWTVADDGILHGGYRNGTYHIGLDGTGDGWVMGSNSQPIGNAILEVDATESAGSTGHPYGVFVRAQDSRNFYGFVISSDASYAAFHLKDGELVIDGPADAALPKGLLRSQNRLQVFLMDATVVYFLNGREIARANAPWPSGTAGVLSAAIRPGKNDVVFDNWKVWTSAADQVSPGAAAPAPTRAPPSAGGSGSNDIDTRINPAALGGGF